jgi:hypothetical protein
MRDYTKNSSNEQGAKREGMARLRSRRGCADNETTDNKTTRL